MASAVSKEQGVKPGDTSIAWGMSLLILAQIAFVSLAAFRSELLIYDEVRWYKIDYFDALVWGLIITQVFAGALHVSRRRVNTFRESIRVFCIIALLALGLTIAAIGFLLEEASGWEEIFSFLSISGGYWLAVFVFLISMFLQLRLVMWCIQALERIGKPTSSISLETNSDSDAESPEDSHRHFSMVDAFSFTGLAAVSIASLRMTLKLMIENDTIRLLTMFYAGSIIAFLSLALYQLKLGRTLKMGIGIGMILLLSAIELQVANSFSTRRMPVSIQFLPLLVWNLELLIVAAFQVFLLHRIAMLKSDEPKQ